MVSKEWVTVKTKDNFFNKKLDKRKDSDMTEIKLKNKEIFPSDEVLENILGKSFTAFKCLNNGLLSQEIIPEWNYYRDGCAWLCKMLFKKKNLGWISVCDGYFNITCYFTEKHIEKIEGSDISQSTKEKFYITKPSGRLIPMTISVDNEQLPKDILIMVLFKKSLK